MESDAANTFPSISSESGLDPASVIGVQFVPGSGSGFRRRMQIAALGNLRVEVAGQQISLSEGHVILLSAFAFGPQDAGVLARALYGELGNPSQALRTNLSRLRNRLGEAGRALVRASPAFRLSDRRA